MILILTERFKKCLENFRLATYIYIVATKKKKRKSYI